MKLRGVISLRNDFARFCAMPNGSFTRVVHDVLEIDEHALGRLRSQVDLGGRVFDGADVGLEHHVEHAGLVERSSAFGAAIAFHVVGAPALLAFAEALAERVDEVGEVSGGGPHLGGHDLGDSRPTTSSRRSTMWRHHRSRIARLSATPYGPKS